MARRLISKIAPARDKGIVCPHHLIVRSTDSENGATRQATFFYTPTKAFTIRNVHILLQASDAHTGGPMRGPLGVFRKLGSLTTFKEFVNQCRIGGSGRARESKNASELRKALTFKVVQQCCSLVTRAFTCGVRRVVNCHHRTKMDDRIV